VEIFFASIQICSLCGHQKRDLKLSDRMWKCPSCGAEHVLDHNAVVNLKKEVIKIRRATLKFTSVENHLWRVEHLEMLALAG
jgi:putative transposase